MKVTASSRIITVIMIGLMVLLGMSMMMNFNDGGPQEVTRVEMEQSIDEFQDKYDIPESELPVLFRNSDEGLWRK